MLPPNGLLNEEISFTCVTEARNAVPLFAALERLAADCAGSKSVYFFREMSRLANIESFGMAGVLLGTFYRARAWSEESDYPDDIHFEMHNDQASAKLTLGELLVCLHGTEDLDAELRITLTGSEACLLEVEPLLPTAICNLTWKCGSSAATTFEASIADFRESKRDLEHRQNHG